MKFSINQKEGFTLVELLIVIMIVGILSIMAVGGYSDYRRAAMLDLSVDNLISQMYGLRDEVNYGDYKEDEGAKCFGLRFEEEEVSAFEVDYSRKKVWEDDKFVEKGCGGDESPLPLGLDDHFFIREMVAIEKMGNGVNHETPLGDGFSIFFIPPGGKFMVKAGNMDFLGIDKIRLDTEFGESGFDKYKRSLYLDLKSGKVQVTKYNG